MLCDSVVVPICSQILLQRRKPVCGKGRSLRWTHSTRLERVVTAPFLFRGTNVQRKIDLDRSERVKFAEYR